MIVKRAAGWGCIWAALMAPMVIGCDDDDGGDEADVGAGFGEQLEAIVSAHGVASISAGVMRDGALVASAARGLADVEGEREARLDTIYPLASCSKPVVGLAAAILADEMPDFDLDADVQDWLGWDPPLAHPDHPDTAVTMRMLLDHTSGIAANSPDDYDTYPAPDPDTALTEYLQPLLADRAYWVGEPGQGELYSNLGVALAGLVIEEAAGQDFRRFCEARIFDPLAMGDTRWFYGDLGLDQRARHAIPYDADGMPYEIYAFNDYPSGLLRSTVPDFARLMAALSDEGRLDGDQALPAAAVQRFHDETLSIEGGDGGFDHSGGEAGVTAYFTYDLDGAGYLYLINTDLDDDATDALEADLGALLDGLDP